MINLIESQIYFSLKNYKSVTTVINCSNITLLTIVSIVSVHWDLLNIGFKCRKATPFGTASEPLLIILRKFRSLERYLFVDNKLTLNESPQRLFTGFKLLPLTRWSVVISSLKRSFFLTLRKFLTFSGFYFDLKTVVVFIWISISCWLRKMHFFHKRCWLF